MSSHDNAKAAIRQSMDLACLLKVGQQIALGEWTDDERHGLRGVYDMRRRDLKNHELDIRRRCSEMAAELKVVAVAQPGIMISKLAECIRELEDRERRDSIRGDSVPRVRWEDEPEARSEDGQAVVVPAVRDGTGSSGGEE